MTRGLPAETKAAVLVIIGLEGPAQALSGAAAPADGDGRDLWKLLRKILLDKASRFMNGSPHLAIGAAAALADRLLTNGPLLEAESLAAAGQVAAQLAVDLAEHARRQPPLSADSATLWAAVKQDQAAAVALASHFDSTGIEPESMPTCIASERRRTTQGWWGVDVQKLGELELKLALLADRIRAERDPPTGGVGDAGADGGGGGRGRGGRGGGRGGGSHRGRLLM